MVSREYTNRFGGAIAAAAVLASSCGTYPAFAAARTNACSVSALRSVAAINIRQSAFRS